MPNAIKLRRSILTVAAVGLVLPSLTNAQDDGAGTEEIIQLDPFAVEVTRSDAYTASNSIAGTRSNTPIREIPLNIQVLTEAFTDDLMLTSQVDVARFNAALINGGDDAFSNNVVQQAYNAFLFRGFRQNWGLRDGVRQYDPVDSQGFSRVEIVKGPAAALYGLSYPGGVINTVTKTVLYGDDFASLSFMLDSEGEFRGTVDANFTGEVGIGEAGVRFNGAYSETKDSRAHSEGRTEYSQIIASWRPTEDTTLEFVGEESFRAHPNGLGYFETGEVGADGNSASIPLQIMHPEISWDWNWANGDMRSIKTKFYRGQFTHSFTDNLSLTGYWNYFQRDQPDADGWDANGGGGSAANWDVSGPPETGWINPGAGDSTEVIRMQYHHRSWNNKGHGSGLTALYSLDLDWVENKFTAGFHQWHEDFISYRGSQPAGTPNYFDFPIQQGISIDVPRGAPSDYNFPQVGNLEESQNSYYFASWQGAFLEGRLRASASINRTEIDLKNFTTSFPYSVANRTKVGATKPMVGGMFDIMEGVSLFGVYSTSLFPTTDKNDFDQQLPPVEGKGIEFGTKFELMEGKISGTISYYQITQTGGAQRDPTALNQNKVLWDTLTPAERAVRFPGQTYDTLGDRGGNPGDLVAGAEAESKGIEVDVIYQPTENWQILLSYAHNNVEITDAVNEDQIGRAPVEGNIDDQFSFVTKYAFTEGSLDGLSLGLGGQISGKANQGYVGDVQRFNPSTTFLEFFAIYRFETMGGKSSIQFNARNLTSQDQFVGWKATGSSTTIATQRYRVPTDIRYSLTYRFDF